MDLFPTLLEEYDLTGAPGVDEFINHVKTNGQSHEHSLACLLYTSDAADD